MKLKTPKTYCCFSDCALYNKCKYKLPKHLIKHNLDIYAAKPLCHSDYYI